MNHEENELISEKDKFFSQKSEKIFSLVFRYITFLKNIHISETKEFFFPIFRGNLSFSEMS